MSFLPYFKHKTVNFVKNLQVQSENLMAEVNHFFEGLAAPNLEVSSVQNGLMGLFKTMTDHMQASGTDEDWERLTKILDEISLADERLRQSVNQIKASLLKAHNEQSQQSLMAARQQLLNLLNNPNFHGIFANSLCRNLNNENTKERVDNAKNELEEITKQKVHNANYQDVSQIGVQIVLIISALMELAGFKQPESKAAATDPKNLPRLIPQGPGKPPRVVPQD